MKKILAMAAVLVAMAVVGSAAATCGNAPSGGTGNVMAAGFSCSLDGLTFSAFNVLPNTGEIDLFSASVNGNDVSLNFNPFLGIGQTNLTDLHFTFTVSGPVTGADLSASIAGATIGETICSTSPAEACTGTTLFAAQVHSLENADCQGNTGVGTIVCNFGGGVNTAYVFKDIGIAQGGSLTSFTESFYTGVPEPMTLSMMGVGLLGLSLISRRRKKS